MTDFNLYEWMLTEKIARNAFHASAILNGLRMWEVEKTEDKKTRIRLYRDWRVSKIFPPKDTASCFEKAIAGEPVPQLELIEGALHSEPELEKQ